MKEKVKDLGIPEEDFDDYFVVDDVKTCQLAHQKFKDKTIDETKFKEILNDHREKGKEYVNGSLLGLEWGKMNFVIFSMLIVTGFIAGSSPLAFIGGTVYLAYLSIKPIFMLTWADANLYEGTHHMPIIKLCEAVYMYRHEEDLVNEESTYRMIQEIIRSSEFLKAIVGSSLRGD